MNLTALRSYFETSPAVRLFRAPSAPYVVDFLDRAFRRPGRITIPAGELVAALEAYRDDVRATDPNALRDRPEAYLSHWCASETRWLCRSLEGASETPSYQLTPHAQEVLTFLDRALGTGLGFVGTESRLRLVIAALDELVVQASDDPVERLARLRADKERIEAEIDRIERGGAVSRQPPARIREQFDTAVDLLRQLQGDFRAVEERFREIARQVQHRHAGGRDPRGGILGFALDAEEALLAADQGASFRAFVRLILDPVQQERLAETVRALGRIPELAGQADGLETVGRMIPLLLAEAERVMRTNQRLSAALRRLLDAGSGRERRRAGVLCAEILALAAGSAADPPTDVGADVETDLAITSPFARTFWCEPPRFAAADLSGRAPDAVGRAAALRQLAQLPRLNWAAIRERINAALARDADVTLSTLLAAHPPAAGAIEVLGYVQLAHDEAHYINAEATEEVALTGADGRARVLTVPVVLFTIP